MKPPKFTETELKEHASQLAAMGMCCINSPSLWESRQPIIKYIEEHFQPSSSTPASPPTGDDRAPTVAEFWREWSWNGGATTSIAVTDPIKKTIFEFAEAYAASVRAASTGTASRIGELESACALLRAQIKRAEKVLNKPVPPVASQKGSE